MKKFTGFAEAGSVGRTISTADLLKFHAYWIEYDPDATCILAPERLGEFYLHLYKPLGCGGEVGDSDAFIEKLRKDTFILPPLPHAHLMLLSYSSHTLIIICCTLHSFVTKIAMKEYTLTFKYNKRLLKHLILTYTLK